MENRQCLFSIYRLSELIVVFITFVLLLLGRVVYRD